MNREIKFRVWHKNYKMIFDVLNINLENKLLEINSEGIWIGDVEFEEVELMQYTGLKDKNGVEIYEGDIVEFLCLNEGLNGIYRVVRANSGEWRIDNNQQGRVLYYSLENVKVVGNAYNNPELLESEGV